MAPTRIRLALLALPAAAAMALFQGACSGGDDPEPGGGDDDAADALGEFDEETRADAGADAPDENASLDATDESSDSADIPAEIDTIADAPEEIPDIREPDAPITRVPESEAVAGRTSCEFGRGAFPWHTIGEEYPVGDEIPINHFIILMQENRSFDHYFGTMPGVDGIPEDYTNPDSEGSGVSPYHESVYCIPDVNHEWDGSHEQYNDGAMDGFLLTNEPNGRRALGYYDETDLPFYHDLYSTFAMSDRHFCSVLGPTWVNRFYFMSGSSFGLIENVPIPMARLREEPYVIFQQLDSIGVPWGIYFTDAAFAYAYTTYSFRHMDRFFEIDEFYEDLAAGELPPVVYLDPSFTHGVEQTDEHPPADMQFGQSFVREVVTAVLESPIWSDTALIITYDEHGGYFDHVAPPEACPPGDYPPDLHAESVVADFDRLGFRVPLVVVSPFSKAGYVSHETTDLTSVLRLVQARFNLPALSGRDANAWPLFDMFDFENPPFAEPPVASSLAEAPIDPDRLAECHALFPDSGIIP